MAAALLPDNDSPTRPSQAQQGDDLRDVGWVSTHWSSFSACDTANPESWRSWDSSDPPYPPSPPPSSCSSEEIDTCSCSTLPNMQTEEIEIDEEPTDASEKGSIGAGLANMGNTCFLNSVLQCLTYTRPIVDHLTNSQHKTLCKGDGFCAMCAFEDHVKVARSSSGTIISPSHFVENLNCISESFCMWQQEDAHEYMLYLIEALHKCCIRCESTSDTSFLSKIFGGRLRSQVKCALCQHCSDTFDPFLDLSLEIDKSSSLLNALANFTSVETVEGENKYHCPRCNRGTIASKQLTIYQPPEVLIIQLKRFNASGAFGIKLDKSVHFDFSLDLTPFISDPQNGKEFGSIYTLYAILVHSGWSTSSGHYYCFVHTANGWHMLNDSWVRRVGEKTVLEQKAYILFYVRDFTECCSGTESNLVKCSSLSSPVSLQPSVPKPSLQPDSKEMNVDHLTVANTAMQSDDTLSIRKKESLTGQITFPTLSRSTCSLNQEDLEGLWSKLTDKQVSATQQVSTSPRCPGLNKTAVDKTAIAFTASYEQLDTHNEFDGLSHQLDTTDVLAKTEISQQSEKSGNHDLAGSRRLGDKVYRSSADLEDWTDNIVPGSCSKFHKGTQQSYIRILSSMPASRRTSFASALPPSKTNCRFEDDTIKDVKVKEGKRKRLLQDEETSEAKKKKQVAHTKRSSFIETTLGTIRQNDSISDNSSQHFLISAEVKDSPRVAEAAIAKQYSDDVGKRKFHTTSKRELRRQKRSNPVAPKDRKNLSCDSLQTSNRSTVETVDSNVAVNESDEGMKSNPYALSTLELDCHEEPLVEADVDGCTKLQTAAGSKKLLASLADLNGSSCCNKVAGPLKISRYFHRVVPNHITEGVI